MIDLELSLVNGKTKECEDFFTEQAKDNNVKIRQLNCVRDYVVWQSFYMKDDSDHFAEKIHSGFNLKAS